MIYQGNSFCSKTGKSSLILTNRVTIQSVDEFSLFIDKVCNKYCEYLLVDVEKM